MEYLIRIFLSIVMIMVFLSCIEINIETTTNQIDDGTGVLKLEIAIDSEIDKNNTVTPENLTKDIDSTW